jgi:hypothetical protein
MSAPGRNTRPVRPGMWGDVGFSNPPRNPISPGNPAPSPPNRPAPPSGDVSGIPPGRNPPAGADGTPPTRPGAEGGGADAPGATRPATGGDAGAAGASATPQRTWGQFLGGGASGVATSATLGLGVAGLTGAFAPGGFGGNLIDAGASVANTALIVDAIRDMYNNTVSSITDNPVNMAIVAGVVGFMLFRR